MKPKTKEFTATAAATLKNEQVQANLRGLYTGFHQARAAAALATDNWEDMRDRARAIKTHTMENLDHYLEMVERNVTKAGGSVFFAADDQAASRYVIDVASSRGVRLVIKGKSMVSEEIGLNERLAQEGIAAGGDRPGRVRNPAGR